jgi:hypothetical protein
MTESNELRWRDWVCQNHVVLARSPDSCRPGEVHKPDGQTQIALNRRRADRNGRHSSGHVDLTVATI